MLDAECCAAVIRELRAFHGWTQRELARRAGVTSQSVSYWERAMEIPSARHRSALAAVVGVTDDLLFPDPDNGCPDAKERARSRSLPARSPSGLSELGGP